jgi:hypothetical protein
MTETGAAFDLVPSDHLEPPSSPAAANDDSARLLDGYLRRLARQEARGRRVLGTLAHAFLRQRGQHALGFARVGDYARERLGISSRELHSLAHVSARLAELYDVAAAFADGALSWTQARLLVDVATPETAAGWVETARGRTVRALEATIARHRGRPVARDDFINDEPRVQIRIPCPRHVREHWHEVTVLARAVHGSDVAPWEVAESIAAEGFSARGVVPGDPIAGLPGPELDPPPESVSSWEKPVALDWCALDEALPADLERLGDGASALNAFTLDRRMRTLLRAMQRIDWQMGRLLRTLFALRLHRLLGFTSPASYARERLGLSPRKARALVALERKTWEVPTLLAAYRDGELSWLRALSIMPVADAHTAPAWIARAKAVTIRRLVDEVEWVVETQAKEPPPPGTPLVLPERQMRAHEVDTQIIFYAPASLAVLLRDALTAFAEPPEPRWRSFERLLEHAQTEWQSLPRHRDPIFARDGWRCAVPACSSRRNLHDHHVLYRSRGGGNERDNRITVCVWHHLRGIHQGRVRAWGTAPDDITWELGVRPGYEPLLRLRGDEYVVS